MSSWLVLSRVHSTVPASYHVSRRSTALVSPRGFSSGPLAAHGIGFDDWFYSYTHPDGSVPHASGPSLERKPSPYFLLVAAARHDLDLARSWMIGDRDSDIACGRAAGARAIFVRSPRAGRAGRA